MKDTVLAIGDFFNVLPDAVVVVNKQGQIVFVSALVERILGYKPDELDGANLEILIPEQHRAHHREMFGNFRKQKEGTPMSSRPVLHARGKGGEDIPVLISIANIRLEDELFSVALIRNATSVRDHLDQALLKAETDNLTGLGNRAYLSRCMSKAIAAKQPFALLFLDLTQFKKLNDRYGHRLGDAVLRTIGKRLQSDIRQHDVVARVGGDEFVMLLGGVVDDDLLMLRAAEITQIIESPISLDGISARVGVNIGGAVFPKDGIDKSELLDLADKNMYRAKSKNIFYAPRDISAKAPLSDDLE